MKRLIIFSAMVFLAAGCCTNAPRHVIKDDGYQPPVKHAQKEIRRGMTRAEVAQELGPPTVVRINEHDNEAWVYERIIADRIYSVLEGDTLIMILTGVPVGKGTVNRSADFDAATATGDLSTLTLRTLTVVIGFNDNMRVNAFSHRWSRDKSSLPRPSHIWRWPHLNPTAPHPSSTAASS